MCHRADKGVQMPNPRRRKNVILQQIEKLKKYIASTTEEEIVNKNENKNENKKVTTKKKVKSAKTTRKATRSKKS